MQAPVLVLSHNTKRESGKKAQLGNIQAAKNISQVIQTCLGPRAMLKMLMDPMGGVVMTNDGNAILREVHILCGHVNQPSNTYTHAPEDLVHFTGNKIVISDTSTTPCC